MRSVVGSIEPLPAAGQPDLVTLQAIAKPGLGHRPALFQIVHEFDHFAQPVCSELC